jgi:exo-beta-1,3-glucanase (GH17 family)
MKRLKMNLTVLGMVWLLIVPNQSSTSEPKNTALIYGIGFSPFEKDQSPWQSDNLTVDQVDRKLKQVAPYVQAVRTFTSSPDYMKNIDELAQKHNVKIFAGAWLGKESESTAKADGSVPVSANEKEFQSILELARRGKLSAVILGSETLLRQDQTEEQLISYLKRFKKEFPNIPVTTADTYDHLLKHPELIKYCDFVFANIYPYWEKVPIDKALLFFKKKVQSLKKRFPKKPIMISETGWPSSGGKQGKAIASSVNSKRYFDEIRKWSRKTKTKVFYFSAFDEAWKSSMEGGVGAHWGIVDETGNLKFKTEGQR